MLWLNPSYNYLFVYIHTIKGAKYPLKWLLWRFFGLILILYNYAFFTKTWVVDINIYQAIFIMYNLYVDVVLVNSYDMLDWAFQMMT